MPVKALVLYHGGCTDGFAAAWVAWLSLGVSAEYVPVSYGHAGADVVVPDLSGRDVYVLDFCMSRDQLLRMHAVAKSLRVLDHHKTAEEACRGLDFCTFDMQRSGARLAWDHFFGAHTPWLVSYVEDRDLWRHALPMSREVNAYVRLQPQEFAAWSAMLRAGVGEAAACGRSVLMATDSYVAAMVPHARVQTFAGHEGVLVVNAGPVHVSELAGRLAESAPFGVAWFQRGDGLYQYSLRSRRDFDVAAIAERYGGGGHKNAAGFSSAVRVDQETKAGV